MMNELMETVAKINDMQRMDMEKESIQCYDRVMNLFREKNEWGYLYTGLWRELAMAKCGHLPSLIMISYYQRDAVKYGYRYIATLADCIRLMALYHLDKDGFSEQIKMNTTAINRLSQVDDKTEEKVKKLIAEKKRPVAVKTVQRQAAPKKQAKPQKLAVKTAEQIAADKKRREMEHIIGVIRELSSAQNTANKMTHPMLNR